MISQERIRLERLSGANRERAIAYLSRSPYANVFLIYAVREATALHPEMRVAFDDDHVVGVGLFGSNVVLAAERVALPAFAETARGRRERAIVGAREIVGDYWELIRASHPPARLVRERQPVMAVDVASLRTVEAAVNVRRARESEWQTVARNSAAMISGEIEADARGTIPEFGLGIRRMIQLGLWWVGERDGRLCFFCNVGAWSDETAQLQGIWTPPEMREQGIASAALGAICRALLCLVPSLSLYVNDFNAPARALYFRLGFRDVGELKTIFF